MMDGNTYQRIKNGEDGDEGTALVSDLFNFLGRFVAYPSKDAQLAHVLWIMHTHLMELWESTPRICFLSPEAGSGKTRCLELTEMLVPRALNAVNVSAAYLFRKVGEADELPTILTDEVDTIFGSKAGPNEDLRGFYNAGHRRGAMAGRCVVKGKKIETEEFPCFAAVALAGLGSLPDTILSRSVIVRMRKRSDEKIESYRRRKHEPEGMALRLRIEQWAARQARYMEGRIPEMPPTITDRDADVWEPLLTIAENIGGDWLAKAHVAAVALVALSMRNKGGLGVKLLSDIRSTLVISNIYKITSVDLVKTLIEMPESPWSDLGGKQLNQNRLASFLRPYDLGPKDIRTEAGTRRGYERADFEDAWKRYLPPLSPMSPMESATGATGATGKQTEPAEPAS